MKPKRQKHIKRKPTKRQARILADSATYQEEHEHRIAFGFAIK
jgi:hypothetical protein